MILSKCLDAVKVRQIYDDPSNQMIVELTLQMIRMWVDEFV